MKKVLLTLCIWLYAMLCIGQGVSHLEFKGIPIDGNLQEFVSKMKLEGFYSKMYNNEGVIMQGDFVGENSHVFIYSTTEEKVVWKVSVYGIIGCLWRTNTMRLKICIQRNMGNQRNIMNHFLMKEFLLIKCVQ